MLESNQLRECVAGISVAVPPTLLKKQRAKFRVIPALWTMGVVATEPLPLVERSAELESASHGLEGQQLPYTPRTHKNENRLQPLWVSPNHQGLGSTVFAQGLGFCPVNYVPSVLLLELIFVWFFAHFPCLMPCKYQLVRGNLDIRTERFLV